MVVKLLIVLLGTLPPIPAAYAVAWLRGDMTLAADLIRVCRRESKCQPLGIHAGDAHLNGYWGQVRLGHLDPACQRPGDGWTTHGALGLGAGSHWAYLPRCYHPSILDVPIVSMWIGAQKIERMCRPVSRSTWCPGGKEIDSSAWRALTDEERATFAE